MAKVHYLGRLVRSLNPEPKSDIAYECEAVGSHRFTLPEEASDRTEEQHSWWQALAHNRCPLCAVEREGP